MDNQDKPSYCHPNEDYIPVTNDFGDVIPQRRAPNGYLAETNDFGDFIRYVPAPDDGISEEHIALINSTFSVKDLFNKHFAPFQRGTQMIVKVTDKYLMLGSGFKGGVDSIYDVKEWSADNHKTAYVNGTFKQRITFEVSRGIRTGSLYLTQDGDIANRDYNYNFNHEVKFEPIEKTLKKFYSYIEKYPDLEFANDKWFTDEYALEIYVSEKHGDLNVSVHQTPNQGSSYYVQGQSTYKFKKPKQTQKVTSQHLLDAVKAVIESKKGFIEN